MDFVGRCASSASFKSFVVLPESRWKDGTPEDYVLRFFAFLETYSEFQHSVKDFLNAFSEKAMRNPAINQREEVFNATFEFLSTAFAGGLKTRKGMTPVNLFEAVAVGAAMALNTNSNILPSGAARWVQSNELRSLTTGPTNSRTRVRDRIEYCRDRFLEDSKIV